MQVLLSCLRTSRTSGIVSRSTAGQPAEDCTPGLSCNSGVTWSTNRKPEGVRLQSSTPVKPVSGAPDVISPIGGIAGLSPSSCVASMVFTLMQTSKPLAISVTNTLSVGVYLLPMHSHQRAYRLALSQWGRAGTS